MSFAALMDDLVEGPAHEGDVPVPADATLDAQLTPSDGKLRGKRKNATYGEPVFTGTKEEVKAAAAAQNLAVKQECVYMLHHVCAQLQVFHTTLLTAYVVMRHANMH